ncbi:MAG: PhnD/SsuA/transferrin family substrate-binding protein [Oscillospiraceae bacterium]
MKRFVAALALLLCLAALAACGTEETPAPEPEEPVALGALTLECAAPADCGADFPDAAREFADALEKEMAARGFDVEALQLTFSRADAATAQALAEGGVQLAVLSSLACAREEGLLPLLALSREKDGAEKGVVCAATSAYGKQLAARSSGASPITWEEWDRAVWGAVESEEFLVSAASLWLSDGCGHTAAELRQWRYYESEDALLAAAEAGEVDVLLLAGAERLPAGGAVLGETMPLYERLFAVSPKAEALLGEDVLAALRDALHAAAETDAGRAFLAQYGCGGFTAVTEEERAALGRLAEVEECE